MGDKVTVSLVDLAKAFEAWENGYRAEPSKFMTQEECASAEVSDISARRAEYLLELLEVIRVRAD